MVLQLGETRTSKKMNFETEIGLKHEKAKFLEFEEETHSGNIYKKDKHHLKIGTGL